MMYLVLTAVIERFYEPKIYNIAELIPYKVYISLKKPHNFGNTKNTNKIRR